MSDVTARPWWLWMEGMGIWRLSASSGQVHHNRLTEAWPEPDDSGWCPTESDPATIGCLTQRARDLWGDPKLYTQPSDLPAPWLVWAGSEDLFARSGMVPLGMGDTEWAALVAACDAASGRGA